MGLRILHMEITLFSLLSICNRKRPKHHCPFYIFWGCWPQDALPRCYHRGSLSWQGQGPQHRHSQCLWLLPRKVWHSCLKNTLVGPVPWGALICSNWKKCSCVTGRIIGSNACSSGWRVSILLALKAGNGCVGDMSLLRKGWFLFFSRLIDFREVFVVSALLKCWTLGSSSEGLGEILRELSTSPGLVEKPTVSSRRILRWRRDGTNGSA